MAAGSGRPRGGFTQHRRIEDLLKILTRHPRGMSLYDLAEVLEVTPRTMRRYLSEVKRHFDIETVTPKKGGAQLWRIRAGELPRKVEMRRTQAYALLAARRLFEPMRGSTLFEEIDMAISKLMAFAQRPGRGPNAGITEARLEDRFLYIPYAPKDYQARTEELDDLFQAVSDLRPLKLNYRSSRSPVEDVIVIHPYAMVLHRDSIYTVAYHTDKHEVRTFVLDRMRNTECSTTERFELPAGFRVEEYFEGEFGIWRSDERHDVVIDFDADAAPYVRMRRVHETQLLEGLKGGGLRLKMTVGSLNPIVTWVLEWGRRATVVAPPELRDRVRDELEAAVNNYR